MTEDTNLKRYDLEDRTLNFAKQVRYFVASLPKNLSVIEDSKQVVRASGSIGTNYIEANEALSKKDFILRIKICRKEAKETRYWLRLLDGIGDRKENTVSSLIKESTELMMIFGAILRKST